MAGHVAWYEQIYGEAPELLVQLEVTLASGESIVFVTDESWQWRTGPILESDLLMGERYDARLELPGWDEPSAGGDWLNDFAFTLLDLISTAYNTYSAGLMVQIARDEQGVGEQRVVERSRWRGTFSVAHRGCSGKTGKDRYTLLSELMYGQLRRYWGYHRNPVWIFPQIGRGAASSEHVCRRMGQAEESMGLGALQTAIVEARRRAGVTKPGSAHTLRYYVE